MTTKADAKDKTRSLGMAAVALATAAAVAVPGAAYATTTPHHATPHDVTMREVARHVMQSGAPGYIARIDNGHRVSTTVAGYADTATGRRYTGREQFEIGSNTKTMTAVLVLQLVDAGRIRLDAPVSAYLSGVVPNGRAITVRMLLNHTSGLFSYTSDPDFFTAMEKDPQHVHTNQELLDVAFRHDPDFAPGQGWNYSNTNYILAGMILEKLTGKGMATLVRERIARPLGLSRTYYADPRATNTGPGYAHGYATNFGQQPLTYTDVSDRPLGGWAGAAGAVISTQSDLSRFFSAVLSAKLFSRQQLTEMRTTVEVPAEFGIKGGYGLGLFRKDSPCGTVWGHGGDTLGHHSTALTTGDGRRTAVSDTNLEPSDTELSAGANRYYQVAVAAEDVTVCEMLGKPVPAAVTEALRGTAATAPAKNLSSASS
ncbi:serine hydrolase [Actinoplanes sp. DH11]|uniref:serine hydrolase domain-containing protein n=1 Tax=Actinoplanes sp. DH11 TaxID=2857011 RepID=UPI001E33FCD0|nr:serine hydrolase domain-containing protein [Actinoplanes sp. DH11]